MGEAEIFADQITQVSQPLGHDIEHAGIRVMWNLLGEPGDADPLPGAGRTRVRLDLPADDPQQRGLACPVATDETDSLTALNGEGDVVQERRQAVGEGDGFEAQQGHGVFRRDGD